MTRSFVQGWLETYNRGDLDGCMACYADDVHFEDPTFAEQLDGRAALHYSFSTFFPTGVTALRFLCWTGGATGGAVEWEWTATWGPNRTFLGVDASNKRFVVRGVSVLTLRDGKIAKQTDYWNAHSALSQLGGLPPGGDERRDQGDHSLGDL